jgi:hypothetical protein
MDCWCCKSVIQISYKGFIGSVDYCVEDLFLCQNRRNDDLVTFEGANVDELDNSFKMMVEECILSGDTSVSNL